MVITANLAADDRDGSNCDNAASPPTSALAIGT
jgi:hypothetical protein